jgi:hypothetical protein
MHLHYYYIHPLLRVIIFCLCFVSDRMSGSDEMLYDLNTITHRLIRMQEFYEFVCRQPEDKKRIRR